MLNLSLDAPNDGCYIKKLKGEKKKKLVGKLKF
jgi:hypothetical protein